MNFIGGCFQLGRTFLHKGFPMADGYFAEPVIRFESGFLPQCMMPRGVVPKMRGRSARLPSSLVVILHICRNIGGPLSFGQCDLYLFYCARGGVMAECLIDRWLALARLPLPCPAP